MDLNKKDMKNIMLLIVFAVLFYIGVQKINSVAAGVVFVWHLVFPFILGGAIAFILNVPMHALEKTFRQTEGAGKSEKISKAGKSHTFHPAGYRDHLDRSGSINTGNRKHHCEPEPPDRAGNPQDAEMVYR